MTNKEKYKLNPIKCEFCNEVMPFRKRLKKHPSRFCNLKCYGKYNTKNTIEEYYKSPLNCKECDDVIPFKKKKMNGKLKFCGNRCQRSYHVKHNPMSEESKKRISEKHKVIQKTIWTAELRKKHSEKMKQVVNENPESYSSKNVCGRVKTIPTVDSFGIETHCLGKWELAVVNFLNKKNIKWSNKIDKIFNYEWNGGVHRYFPDFYLTDYDAYIEVKGYERGRDRAKWNQFKEKLIIIKKKEIQQIKEDSYVFQI